MSSSRARTRDRRKARERQTQRNRQLLLLVLVVILAVLAVVVYVITSQPVEAPVSEQSVTSYADIPQSVTAEGFPLLGNPDAPVQVSEFSSFDCPHCGVFYQDVTPMLIARAGAGEVAFTYLPLYGTGGIANGQGAARAALCAGEQDAFWVYHGALFDWQQTYGNQAYASNRLRSGILNLDLDADEWDACMNSDRPDQVLREANILASRTEGMRGTPTVLVNGQIVNPTLAEVEAAVLAVLTAG